MSKSLVALLKRAGIAFAFLLAANLIVVFFWSPPWFVYWQVPISCTIFILFLGITLYDTLFFDRPR